MSISLHPNGTLNCVECIHTNETIELEEKLETGENVPDINGTQVAVVAIVASDEQPREASISERQRKWRHIKKLMAGVTLAILAAFCFAITGVIVKYVTDMRASQMALFRFVGILIMTYPVVQESTSSIWGENQWLWRLYMLIRGVCGCTSIFFRYSAFTLTSLADATIIITAMPVFVFILARIFLGEAFGRYHVLALVLSLLGIAFASNLEMLLFEPHKHLHTFMVNGTGAFLAGLNMTTPMTNATTNALSFNCSYPTNFTLEPENCTDLYQNTTQTPSLAPYTNTPAQQFIGSLYALGAMAFASMVYVMVRLMRKTHHAVILFWFALIAVIEMSLVNYIFYNFELPKTGYSAWLVTILAILSFYGQMMLIRAIQLEEAGVVSLVRVSAEAFFAFIFQITIFHEMPSVWTFLGAILVLSSVCLLSFRKYICSLPDGSQLKKRFRFLTY